MGAREKARLPALLAAFTCGVASASIEGVVADPASDRFVWSSSSTTTGSLHWHDPLTSTDGSCPLPEPTGSVAIEPDGSRAYVALMTSHDIAVVDMATGVMDGVIDLAPMTGGPWGLAMSRQGRLHAVIDDEPGPNKLLTIDTASRTESSRVGWDGALCWGASPRGWIADAVSDARGYYAVTRDISPSYVYGWDVESEPPRPLGCQCDHVMLQADGSQLALAPDGSGVYHAGIGASCVRLLTRDPPFGLLREYPSPGDGVAVSRDGRTLFAGASPDLVAYDTLSGVPFHSRSLGMLSTDSLHLSTSGRWLAAVTGTTTERIGFVDVESRPLTVNRGAIVLRPRWRGTSQPIATLDVQPGRPGLLDVEGGVVEIGVFPAGPVTLRFGSGALHGGFDLPTSIVAGALTDLGVVEFDQERGAEYPEQLCTRPPPCVGTSARIAVSGLALAEDVDISSDTAEVTVLGFERLNWARAIVDVAVSSAAAGTQRLWVTNPGATRRGASFWVRSDAADPLAAPGAVADLRLRREGADVRFTWTGFVTGLDGCTDDTERFEIWSSPADPAGFVAWRDAAVPMHAEPGMAVPAGNTPTWYVVRARDVAGTLGD